MVCIIGLFFRSPDSMPTLKMMAKLSKTCKRDGGYPHVSPKSNKISKNSCSQVRVTHDPADLDTSTQTFQDGLSKNGVISEEHENGENRMSYNGDETMLKAWVSQVEDSDSIEKTDVSPSYLSSSLGTMFSPSTVSSDANCIPVDAVRREQNALAPQVDDDDYGHRSNNSSIFQTSNALDSSVYEMCLAGFSTDRISVPDYVNYDIFVDHELDGTNMIYDITEGFPFFPSPEETIEAVDSHYGGSCEEFQQISDYSWFHNVCQQTKPFNQELDNDPSHFDPNEIGYSDPESFIRSFPELSDDSDSLPALVSKETSRRKHVTLVLDLDETLVHSTLEPCNGADFTVQVFFNKKEHTVYVRQRPFLKSFLERVSQMFEIIIFTASQSIYAEKVLDIIDPNRELFSRRVFRESCIYLDGSYTKDLTVLGIDLAKVVIIDNSPQVFRLQVNNGIPIKSWFDDPSDNALNSLLPFLETLVDVDDVRPIIAKKFGVNN